MESVNYLVMVCSVNVLRNLLVTSVRFFYLVRNRESIKNAFTTRQKTKSYDCFVFCSVNVVLTIDSILMSISFIKISKSSLRLFFFNVLWYYVPYLRSSVSDRMFAICDCFKSRDDKFFVT